MFPCFLISLAKLGRQYRLTRLFAVLVLFFEIFVIFFSPTCPVCLLFLLLSFLFVVSLFLESPPIELGRKPPVALLQTPSSEAAATEPGREPDFRDLN